MGWVWGGTGFLSKWWLCIISPALKHCCHTLCVQFQLNIQKCTRGHPLTSVLPGIFSICVPSSFLFIQHPQCTVQFMVNYSLCHAAFASSNYLGASVLTKVGPVPTEWKTILWSSFLIWRLGLALTLIYKKRVSRLWQLAIPVLTVNCKNYTWIAYYSK